MRRKENEIRDVDQITTIINKALICRIGINGEDFPYVVPVNFGYKDSQLYFHSSCEGLKITMIKKNPAVCLQFDTDVSIMETPDLCNWSTRYKSVMAYGLASFVENEEEKIEALDIIIKHYKRNFKGGYSYGNLDKLCIIRVDIEKMTGKKSL